MTNKDRISARIPEELRARLDALAVRLKTTITKIVTPPIEREVRRLEKKIKRMDKQND